MPRLDEHGNCPGSIRDLRLPPRAWYVLRRENITTMNKLCAVADRLERVDGIGSKLAQAIRAELARIEQPSDKE
jgi:DNA-directed RNA polymerase alpha subunit